MKAYLVAHMFLAPFIIFTILAPLGYPLAGAVLGFLVGLIFCANRYGLKLPPAFMATQVAGILIVLLTLLITPLLKETTALAILFTFLALGALISVVKYKPWTAELSAADVGDFANHPAFIKSNVFFSSMWMVIFAWFAYANWQELAPIFRWVPMILGGLVTIIGPKILMNIGIKRGLFDDPRHS